MRLADAVFRHGHLSEDALAEVYLTGERPLHLDQCDLCAERAVEVGRWLDDVRHLGVEDADAAFPPERLAVQQAQILRRLEQVDRPARVIAFPRYMRTAVTGNAGRGIRPAWVGIAAAAGLVLGVLASQLGARMTPERAAVPSTPPTVQQPAAPTSNSVETANATYQPPKQLQEVDESEWPSLPSAEALDAMTPRQSQIVAVSLRTGRVP